jgi:hypothetical protein
MEVDMTLDIRSLPPSTAFREAMVLTAVLTDCLVARVTTLRVELLSVTSASVWLSEPQRDLAVARARDS